MQTISYSRLSLFDKCPKAYEFKYIDKIQESFITIELHMGRCVHSVLEHAYTESINQRKTSLEELLSYYHSIWNSNELLQAKVVKKEKTKDSYFRDGEMMIRSYYSKVFINDRSQTISLEKKLVPGKSLPEDRLILPRLKIAFRVGEMLSSISPGMESSRPVCSCTAWVILSL